MDLLAPTGPAGIASSITGPTGPRGNTGPKGDNNGFTGPTGPEGPSVNGIINEIYNTPGTGVYTLPGDDTYVYQIQPKIIGGGGGGGYGVTGAGGGGGGQGASYDLNIFNSLINYGILNQPFKILGGKNIYYSVGAGGTGALYNNSNASAGGSSSFYFDVIQQDDLSLLLLPIICPGGHPGGNGKTGGLGGDGGAGGSVILPNIIGVTYDPIYGKFINVNNQTGPTGLNPVIYNFGYLVGTTGATGTGITGPTGLSLTGAGTIIEIENRNNINFSSTINVSITGIKYNDPIYGNFENNNIQTGPTGFSRVLCNFGSATGTSGPTGLSLTGSGTIIQVGLDNLVNLKVKSIISITGVKYYEPLYGNFVNNNIQTGPTGSSDVLCNFGSSTGITGPTGISLTGSGTFVNFNLDNLVDLEVTSTISITGLKYYQTIDGTLSNSGSQTGPTGGSINCNFGTLESQSTGISLTGNGSIIQINNNVDRNIYGHFKSNISISGPVGSTTIIGNVYLNNNIIKQESISVSVDSPTGLFVEYNTGINTNANIKYVISQTGPTGYYLTTSTLTSYINSYENNLPLPFEANIVESLYLNNETISSVLVTLDEANLQNTGFLSDSVQVKAGDNLSVRFSQTGSTGYTGIYINNSFISITGTQSVIPFEANIVESLYLNNETISSDLVTLDKDNLQDTGFLTAKYVQVKPGDNLSVGFSQTGSTGYTGIYINNSYITITGSTTAVPFETNIYGKIYLNDQLVDDNFATLTQYNLSDSIQNDVDFDVGPGGKITYLISQTGATSPSGPALPVSGNIYIYDSNVIINQNTGPQISITGGLTGFVGDLSFKLSNGGGGGGGASTGGAGGEGTVIPLLNDFESEITGSLSSFSSILPSNLKALTNIPPNLNENNVGIQIAQIALLGGGFPGNQNYVNTIKGYVNNLDAILTKSYTGPTGSPGFNGGKGGGIINAGSGGVSSTGPGGFILGGGGGAGFGGGNGGSALSTNGASTTIYGSGGGGGSSSNGNGGNGANGSVSLYITRIQ